MDFKVRREETAMAHYIADEPLWLNADRTKVVREDDEAAAFLFAPAGGRINVEDAERYGLTGLDFEDNPKEEKAQAAPKATKAVEKPAATKSAPKKSAKK